MTLSEVCPPRRVSSEGELRARAVDVARFACNGDAGRVLGDPVFDAVTEGRARWKQYSACGDLAHYVLKELGFRDERIVNRDDDGGSLHWTTGANLSRLVYSSGDAFVWAKPALRPRPGDILYVAPPEHVCVLELMAEDAGAIATFDYGQFDYALGKPAGKRCVRTFALVEGKTLRVGSRVLRGWLDISKLPGLLPG
jgi:hypothetical protein